LITQVSGTFGGIRGWGFGSLSERVATEIRYDFYKSIITKDIPFFDRNKSGDLSKNFALN
jgi:ABC-type bacteriocin/lantibiotic exporter with double-glycine peptidase domain